jgi:hypothetical protein
MIRSSLLCLDQPNVNAEIKEASARGINIVEDENE